MSSRKFCLLISLTALAAALMLAGPAQCAQDPYQSPYGQQQLPTPNSPYPDMNNPAPYGGNQGYQPQQQPQQQQQQQQGYQPQQQQQPNYPPQQQAPAGGGGQALVDVLGQFRLSLDQNVMPMSATYSFGIPSAGVQVNIMSVAQPQALLAQKQQFLSMLPQMGGRIAEQRQINVGGRPAELVAVTMSNPQNQQQFIAFNIFLSSVSVWIQVMGPAQSQAQVQQAANMILQGMQTR